MSFIEELNESFPVLNDEIDTSFLVKLLYYFPIDKIYISAGSYDQYLYDLEKTVIDNYDAGNYQVSFFYAHLIFMSYVYYCVERAYQFKPERMKDIFYPINAYSGRNDKPDLDKYKSVYEFSKIPEKDIFKIFRIMGMEHSQIKELSQYISDRDDYAHATGKGNISEEALIQNIRTITCNMESLSSLFRASIRGQYIQFLLDNAESQYDDMCDNTVDLIFDNSYSLDDIKYLCSIGISGIRDENEEFRQKYRFVKKIHCAFIENCINEYGIDQPANYPDLRDEAYLLFRYKGKANEYIENELGISEYRCVKEGGVFPVYECPECGEEQLAHDSEKGKYHCFSCDEDFTDDDISFCERCGNIMRHDPESAICQNCVEYLMEE